MNKAVWKIRVIAQIPAVKVRVHPNFTEKFYFFFTGILHLYFLKPIAQKRNDAFMITFCYRKLNISIF